MEEHPRIARQRQYIERRADELLERVPFMDDAELRWTIRVLRDCLPPAEQQEMLRDYSEHLELNQMRQVVGSFILPYTEYALEALEAKRFTPGMSLRDLTNEELQSMSATEKWGLLAQDPATLHPYQLRGELARLFLCRNFDLFHDPGLGEAAVEFSVYLDLLERLARASNTAIEGLKDEALATLRGLDHRDVTQVEGVLTTLREAIGRSVGLFPPFDDLFSERMERWPRSAPAELEDVVNPEIRAAVAGMNLKQLQTSLRVLLELMSLEEQRREIEPLKARYHALDEIPEEALAALLPHLSMRLGDRTICDFALRYRSGRLWARERIDPQVWKLLTFQDKFMLLEADNEAMDLLQVSRHLARLLLTERYELLFDPAYQVGLIYEPLYHRVLDHCMGDLTDSGRFKSLNRQVTRMMLELEAVLADGERPARFLEIREVIGTGFKSGPIPSEG
ncbi:MAG: hypothetical protein HYS14_04550 [Candidatus Rokubacteria bacterium]|nr:hypothetical protein [Candidatus Rokubacteria bacterium]